MNTYKRRTPFPSTAQWGSNDICSSTRGLPPSGSQSYTPSLSTNGAIQDWSFRPELTSYKVSPAVNNPRSISTPINYHRRSPSSLTGSTSKSHTPLPLYYDYTEDFIIAEATTGGGATEAAPSSVSFILSKAVYENRESATEALPHYDSNPQGPSTNVEIRVLATSSNTDNLEPSDDKHRVNSEDSQTERSTNVTQDIIPLYLDRRPYDRILADPIKNMDFLEPGKFVGFLDGELPSTHDKGKEFNLTPLKAVDGTNHNLNIAQSPWDKESLDHRNDLASGSDNTSSFRLSTYLSIFPKPPDLKLNPNMDQDLSVHHDAPARLLLDTISVQKTRKPAPQITSEGLGYIDQHHLATRAPRHQQDMPTSSIQRSATTHGRRIRSSRYYSIDHGLSDLAQLISNFEFANGSSLSQDVHTPSAELSTPPLVQVLSTSKLPNDLRKSQTKALFQLDALLDTRMPISKFRSDGDLRTSSSRTFQAGNHALQEKFISSDNYGVKRAEVLSFPNGDNGPVSMKSLSLSGTPLLAPKAISLARVLKLKNSVPQLMKALPPVPQNSTAESLLSQESSPHRSISISGPRDSMRKKTSADIEPIPLDSASFHSLPSQRDLEDTIQPEQTFSPHPKFRIKSRFFDTQRSHSPANSRPWNLNENCPWYSQQSTIRLSSLRSMLPRSQRGPRFKLRVTRAPTSLSGTIRIHPEARSSLDLRFPKDLFISNSNLSGIFRQVNRQFSSKKSSSASETAPKNGTLAPFAILASTQGKGSHGHSPDLLRPPVSSTMAYPKSPTDVRSFFSEDNSQIRGHNSLRKRISNLRARIPNPYISRPTSRLAAHSNDNEAWRGNLAQCAPIKGRSRTLITSEHEDEYGMPIASLQRRRLRSKVSKWFKDAGLAMRCGMKLHNSADVHCIPCR
jgi:hypothetical protein